MADSRLKAKGLEKLEPGKHYDGAGLELRVEPSGSRHWVLRTMVRKKRREIGLGSLSTLPLSEARIKAAELRAKARKGEDIVGERKEEREAEKRTAAIPVFEDAATIVHKELAKTFDSEDHAHNWLQSLKTYVNPVFGKKTVDKIDSSDVLAAIGPIWTEKADTAGRTLRRIKAVFDWCIVKGYRTVDVNGMKVTMPNPCDAIRAALPKRNGAMKHHEALPYAKLPGFISKLRTSPSALSVKLAFEFLILTAARTGEVLGATWEEIDIEAKTWTIPANRMKMKEPHKVPLSARAIEILELARQFNDSKIVFPGRYAGHSLSQMALLMTLRRMGHADLTAHGFRATFKTWAQETTKTDHLVIEASMAHAVKGIERHYLRTSFFEQRRKLMDAWARFATTPPKAKVVSSADRT
jgi:integrase